MTIFDMFGQSAVLALLGMAVVFSFLIILVLTVLALGKLVKAFGLDKDVAPRPLVATAAPSKDAAVVAAIGAAVAEYRKTN